MDEIGLATDKGYATLVLDHVSGLSDLILSELLGKPVPEQKGWGLASQQQYGQLSAQCKDILRKLLDYKGNVVIVGQQRTFGGKDDGLDPDLIKPTVAVAVTPSLAGWLQPACDYVLQTYKRPKMVTKTRQLPGGKTSEYQERDATQPIEYAARCAPHDVFSTKFRVPKGHFLPESVVDPSYDKVMQILKGEYREQE